MANKKRIHEYRGIMGTAQELIEKFGAPVSERGIYRRLLAGMTIAEAMTKPIVQHVEVKHSYTIDGIEACLPDHVRRYGVVSISTAKARVKAGWSIVDAVKTPPLPLAESLRRSQERQAHLRSERKAGRLPPLRPSMVYRRGEKRPKPVSVAKAKAPTGKPVGRPRKQTLGDPAKSKDASLAAKARNYDDGWLDEEKLESVPFRERPAVETRKFCMSAIENRKIDAELHDAMVEVWEKI